MTARVRTQLSRLLQDVEKAHSECSREHAVDRVLRIVLWSVAGQLRLVLGEERDPGFDPIELGC